ncbi:hypothetical protein D9M70_538440 [compost metagenome]
MGGYLVGQFVLTAFAEGRQQHLGGDEAGAQVIAFFCNILRNIFGYGSFFSSNTQAKRDQVSPLGAAQVIARILIVIEFIIAFGSFPGYGGVLLRIGLFFQNSGYFRQQPVGIKLVGAANGLEGEASTGTQSP